MTKECVTLEIRVLEYIMNIEIIDQNICNCVSKHVPLPRIYKTIVTNSGVEYVCPTTFDNIQHLIEQYRKYQGQPPGKVRKHYSDFVQRLVIELIDGGRAIL